MTPHGFSPIFNFIIFRQVLILRFSYLPVDLSSKSKTINISLIFLLVFISCPKEDTYYIFIQINLKKWVPYFIII